MSNLPPSKFFPPVEKADSMGLLAVGGRLTPAWLLDAYRHGIFPWPVGDDLLAWWSPDPRAVLPLDELHVSRRLARTCRGDQFSITIDHAFPEVMRGCATAQARTNQTWITPAMIRGYRRLHDLGMAHSIEVWHEGRLAGGLYGVSLGAMFAAESMFYLVRDASKMALVALVGHLRSRGYELLDVQQKTLHTEQFGVTEIPRGQFIEQLRAALARPLGFGTVLEGWSFTR